jgi:hypothetical protein
MSGRREDAGVAMSLSKGHSAEKDVPTALATLYVNLSDSRCGWCNKSALPHDKRHETPCGWDQHPGCGAEFIAVSSDYSGASELYERIRAMRPDLPFIDPMTARVTPPAEQDANGATT